MRKDVLFLMTTGILLTSVMSSGQEAVKYPIKPLTCIINVAAGGGGDLTTRALCKIAEGFLGQPIIMENKPGGAGVIGINLLAKSKPDGYTIGRFTCSPIVVIPHVRNVPYNPREDFTFLCQVAEYAHAFVVKADAPWKTFKDFIEDARKKPGQRTYCTQGVKSTQHIFMQQIEQIAKVKLRHIPYSGNAEELPAVLGGHVDGGLIAAVAPHIKGGSLRALATNTQTRWKILPNVPTFTELGYKIEDPEWLGVAGPKGMPKDSIQKLRNAFEKAAKDPNFHNALEQIYMIPLYRSGQEFEKIVLRDYDTLGAIIKKMPSD